MLQSEIIVWFVRLYGKIITLTEAKPYNNLLTAPEAYFCTLYIARYLTLTYSSLANSAETDQTPPNAASDQVLHCLFTECSIKIEIEKK